MTSLPRASEWQRSSVPLSALFKSSATVWHKLDDYQQNAVCFAYEKKTVALFFEQGTGKTWIAAGLLEALGSSQSSLVIVPKNNKDTTWIETLKANLPHIYVHTSWETFKAVGYYGILVLHYEALTPNLVARIRRRQWTCIIYDECHRLKNRGSKISRRASQLRNSAEYKLGLSGTPLEKSPQDVWAQMRFINPHCFGDKWEPFKKRYLRSTGFMGHKLVFREDRRKEFMRKLTPWALREEVSILNLPPMTIEPVLVARSELQKEVYRAMLRSSVVRLNAQATVQAPLKITRNMKLSQIAGGFITHDRDVYWLGYGKMRECRRILAVSPLPVVIFCRFKPEIEMLERHLGKRYKVAIYSGKTKNKADIQRNFQAGQYDVLICQLRAGGVGIDLFRACVGIVYSADWSSINFSQLKSRLYRRGQKNETTLFLLISQSTIDVRLVRRILQKSKDNDLVLKQLKGKSHGRDERGLRPRNGPGSRGPHRSDKAASGRHRKERRQISVVRQGIRLRAEAAQDRRQGRARG